jgi:hypothetical protein
MVFLVHSTPQLLLLHEVCRFMNFLFLVAASDVEPDAFGAWVMM